MIFNHLIQEQRLFTDDHIAAHQEFPSSDIWASLQSAMAICSNRNGDDGFSKPKIRRASKNDRHSKISTAQGPRDRRMRLSLDVGKKFFKLQDMLGFDKASKTVEWLLTKSKANIQELIPHGNSRFSCEFLSEYIDGDQNMKSSSGSNQKGKKKTSKGVRKSRPLAKETREMARKRARERTLVKSSNKLVCVSGGDDQFSKFTPFLDQTMEQDANYLGSSVINQPDDPSFHFHLKQGVIDDSSSSMISSWNSNFFDYQQTGVHLQEHPFNDFQTSGNLWEVKN